MEPNLTNPNTKESFWKELVKLVLIAVVVVVPFRLFIAQPFIVDGASMDPTFKNGQYLVVDELSYHFNAPERGSVLIFKYPKNPDKYYIKRVIGLPNEQVIITKGQVKIINAEYPEGITLDEPYIVYSKDDTSTYKVGENEYFVMGDNRAGSSDSRYWGQVPEKNIIGRPILRAWPFTLWPGASQKFIEENEKEN
jgi:signal peptidase I, bacterial type